MMHILYLHQYFKTPEESGGSRSYELARRLVDRGFRVSMITSKTDVDHTLFRWTYSNISGIEVYYIHLPYSNSLSFPQRLQKFFAFAFFSSFKALSLNADFIYATSTPLTIAIPALLCRFFKHMPFIFEVRDMWPSVPIAMGVLKSPFAICIARLLESLAYKYSKHIVALAPGMAQDIQFNNNINPSKITVIPNGCDNHLFDVSYESSNIQDKFPWLESKKVVLYAGTFGLANGCEFILKLASQLIDNHPGIIFVCIGEGSEFAYFRSQAALNSLLTKNVFLFNSMPKADLIPWLHACDITLALFSGPRVLWKDAVQNKFFDSLAAGKPVASNFLGYQSEIALQENAGIVLPSDDIKRASNMLVKYLYDDSWLNSASINAKNLALTRFSRNQQSDVLVSLIYRLFLP